FKINLCCLFPGSDCSRAKLIATKPCSQSERMRANMRCAVTSAFALLAGSGQSTQLIKCVLLILIFGLSAAAQTVSVSPASLSFGADQLGVTTSSQKITVKNTGSTPVSNISIAISGE